ncbi:MAG: hypothetical protein M3Q61_03725 [Chloroflexota bacterium]|nr:hypothetical protein [Chloroflexota bacterium]
MLAVSASVMPSPVQAILVIFALHDFPAAVVMVTMSPTLAVPRTRAPHAPDFSFAGLAVIVIVAALMVVSSFRRAVIASTWEV